MEIGSLAVFCGSSRGRSSAYADAAGDFGRRLARRGVRVVFGGGSVGMMGAVADAALAAGGEAVGVIPRGLLAREVGHESVTRLHVVETMHERKALLSELSDGFVALPGGIGTLEELMEVWTWAQLGIHRKPIALLNVAGYFDGLLAFIDHAVAAGFVGTATRDLLLVADTPERLFDALAAWTPPDVPQWLGTAET